MTFLCRHQITKRDGTDLAGFKIERLWGAVVGNNAFKTKSTHKFSHSYTHIPTYTHIYPHIPTYTHTYTHTYAHMYTCTHVHVYTFTHLHIYTFTHLHICTFAHLHICTFAHLFTFTHTQHTCSHTRNKPRTRDTSLA